MEAGIMKTSEMINEISKAMSLAQGEMKPASKSTVNPFFKSTYSSLAQVVDSIREPFAKNSLCFFQNVSSTEGGVEVSTRVCHSSGQWIEFGPMVVPLTKKDAQSVGSATTYGKRYSLSAAVGVVSDLEDDDGEAAMNRNGENTKPPKTKEKPKANPIMPNELGALMSVSVDCSEEYMNKVYKHMKDQYGFETFAQITQDIYPQILNGMKKNAELQKAK